ncbi:Uncharacterised protein [Candidatus Gugararchaeum adminiculabundum]|nr:Uncharacterised protein [Candidatus Gugararchaeum adminiculabundum]
MPTTIAIGTSTRESLRMFGRKGETYDEIIKKLMGVARLHGFLEEQKRILREEKFVPLD